LAYQALPTSWNFSKYILNVKTHNKEEKYSQADEKKSTNYSNAT